MNGFLLQVPRTVPFPCTRNGTLGSVDSDDWKGSLSGTLTIQIVRPTSFCDQHLEVIGWPLTKRRQLSKE